MRRPLTPIHSLASLNIAVVGSGIAGAAAALFLKRAGHRVSRFERSEPDASCGAGLLLQPPAIAVLRAAGLDSKIWSLGDEVDYVGAHFVASRQSVRLDYSEFDQGARACGILRAALIQVIENANENSNDVRWSTHISNVDTQAGTLQTTKKELLGPFDLIVAADGARSTVRSRCPELLIHDRPYKDAAIVCLIDNPSLAFGRGVIQHFRGGAHVSTWPVGALSKGGMKRLAIALRTDSDSLSRLTANPAEWLANVDRIHSGLVDLIRASPGQPELLAYTYRDVATRCYHSHRAVLIGDAAHAMSPQLGLGASLGLLDAWHLAKCLKSGGSVGQALANFDRVRRSDIAAYQRLSRVVTPLFQSDHPIVAALRERSAVFFGHSDVLRQRALATLCAVPPELL